MRGCPIIILKTDILDCNVSLAQCLKERRLLRPFLQKQLLHIGLSHLGIQTPSAVYTPNYYRSSKKRFWVEKTAMLIA